MEVEDTPSTNVCVLIYVESLNGIEKTLESVTDKKPHIYCRSILFPELTEIITKSEITGMMIQSAQDDEFTRNNALKLIPEGECVLFIDSGDVVKNCVFPPIFEYNFYYVNYVEGNSSILRTLLFKNEKVQYTRRAYEILNYENKIVPISSIGKSLITIDRIPPDGELLEYRRNLLQKDYDDNPMDSTTLFYMGRVNKQLCNIDDALEFYHRRIGMSGNIVHYYVALVDLTEITPEEKNKIAYSKEAYKISKLIDPLLQLYHLHIKVKNYKEALKLITHICGLNVPKESIVPINMTNYSYYRWRCLAECLFLNGQYGNAMVVINPFVTGDKPSPNQKVDHKIYKKCLEKMGENIGAKKQNASRVRESKVEEIE